MKSWLYKQEEKVTWIIGDVHGMCDPLHALIRQLDSEWVDKFVFVGDYIDHGPSSKEVLDLIMGLGDKAVTLMGNHEYLLLQTLYNERHRDVWGYRIWKENGAEATINSFGYADFAEFEAKIDAKYTNFLKNLPLFHVETLSCGDTDLNFLITHAGLMPSVPVAEQLAVNSYPTFLQFLKESKTWIEDSFIWIRGDFLKADPDIWKEYIVVHGHTPTHLLNPSPLDLPPDYDEQTCYLRRHPENNRIVSIDVDTGAAFGNRLTAIGLSRGWMDIYDTPGLTIRVAQLDIKTGYYNQEPISFEVFNIEL